MRNSSFPKLAPALLALLVTTVPAVAAEPDELALLRDQLHSLEQKILVLERKQELKDEAVAAAAKTTPKITVDGTGFTLASADGSDFIRLRGLVQADSRWFINDNGIANNKTFLIRRARLIFEGAFDKVFSFQLVPEFGGGAGGVSNAPVLYDANVGATISPALQFKAGKFKSPIGQEMLQNDAVLLFAERSLATNLVPFRDIGVQASGDLLAGRLSYTAAVLNGGADATYTSNLDLENNKDFVGRLIARPFKNDGGSALSGLSFGVAGSHKVENKTGSLTTGYKTDGQQTFFTYRSTVIPYGPAWRVFPQVSYYAGSLSVQGEYTVSAVNAVVGTTARELRHEAWQTAVGYVLTGEDAAYGGIKPKQPFNLDQGNWGAVEVGVRYARLDLDPHAFPLFSDPAASARGASAFSLGVNWYPTQTVRATVDFSQTRFDRVGSATTNAVIGRDENAIITRFQIGF